MVPDAHRIKGEKRPADVIANAVRVMRIATGEETEELTSDGKNVATVSLGRAGGKARAESIAPGWSAAFRRR